jgi:endonuclease YncB( thermonuclease family)
VYRLGDDFFLNLEIIRQGYGFAYTKYPFSKMEEFRAAEHAAREAGRGLWAPEEPSD